MTARLLHPDEWELASRSSVDSQGTFNLDEADFEAQVPSSSKFGKRKLPWLSQIFSSASAGYRRLNNTSRPILAGTPRPSCSRRLCIRRCCYLPVVAGIVFVLALFTSLLFPSYTHLPAHYSALRKSVLESSYPGRGNPRKEKVFIAASLYDSGGKLAQGQWGTQLLVLIDLLGPDNVFLSIYENDSGDEGERALRALEEKVECQKSIVSEKHLDLNSIPTVTIPGGSKRIKRIEYLAQVRNRALQPLTDHPEMKFDKLLYLNDILFQPAEVPQLLFSTNANEDGVAQYRAACAVDFDNPIKFYDTYATRDLEGYSMGLPFYPWFTSSGKGESRSDVLAGKDAVRVRSCWGGMVAFDAKYFQSGSPPTTPNPARFRSGQDLFWEASECCLIHADIQDPQTNIDEITDTGIYMNPFVRTAYDSRTLSWLGVTRRFEGLYSFLHNLGNHLVGLPWYNPRRAEVPGQIVKETVWVPDAAQDGNGSFQAIDRVAGNDGYCGRRGLQVIIQDRKPGQKGYESIPIPS
ncbi:CAZyme family GT69 [Penicillium roqueforti]|nr:CAZyme family GT69 [Penicillium roqueforti]KAI3099847.1 CAZyme family GT69 [Penicillium roqueforti]